MLGMVSGQISDAQISASSYADRGWVAENARLLTGRSGWTGQQVKQPFRNEWLQVGLTAEYDRFTQIWDHIFVTFPLSSSLAGGSGPGQDGERRADPGRETPRQERLYEEVQGGPQSERRGLDHGQGGQHHQGQGGF